MGLGHRRLPAAVGGLFLPPWAAPWLVGCSECAGACSGARQSDISNERYEPWAGVFCCYKRQQREIVLHSDAGDRSRGQKRRTCTLFGGVLVKTQPGTGSAWKAVRANDKFCVKKWNDHELCC